MSVQKFFPCDALKSLIDFYWLYNANEDGRFNQLLPAGYVEIGFKLNDAAIITVVNGVAFPVADIKIMGQLTSPGGAVKSHSAELLVVRFFTHTASLFFSHHMAAFTDRFYDFKEVFHAEKDSLYNRIREQKTICQKIGVIENFLLSQFAKNTKKIAVVKPIAYLSKLAFDNNSAVASSTLELKSIAQRLGFSDRYLRRIFEEHVGISPKTYLKIMRFQRSLALMESNESYTAIAFKCGYFDQAHLNKEFKNYTGVSPAAYHHIKEQYEVITL